jgi:cyanate permease
VRASLRLAPRRRQNRLLTNRRLWKTTIYGIAFLTYVCSFLFFVLAVGQVRQSGATMLALIDLVVALYFLVQVIFLFLLSDLVERRRQSRPIDFADRRGKG